jgi:G3E family GTPase
MTGPVPVTLIGGYLGAGKTTLVNHLLRNAGGRRLAVLVNEFGALPIDADLIEARDGNLISISGGCICCSFGSDLVGALIDLKERSATIDHLLIETSGVALPQSIVQSLALLQGLVIDGVIILADAETVMERADDRYMSDTVRQQLAHADLILLNKTDLISSEQLDAIARWLSETVPGCRILPVRHAKVPLEIIVGQHPRRQPDKVRMPPLRHQTSAYETLTVEIDTPCDPEQLAGSLTDPALGLLRAKGFVRRSDGAFAALHIVGRRSQIEPAPAWIEGPGRLVCIGLKTSMADVAIRAAIDRSTRRQAPDSILPINEG